MQDHNRPITNAHHSSGPGLVFEEGSHPSSEIGMPEGYRALSPEKTPGGFRTGVFFGDGAARNCPAALGKDGAVAWHSLAQESQHRLRR
jgi:hypothetical protein